MAVLTIRDILRGQTTLDTIILRRLNGSANSKSAPFKYVFIPTSYLSSSPTPAATAVTTSASASASASGVQPTMTPPLIPSPMNKDDPSTPPSTSTPLGYLCHVLPHERLYDLGRRENWRRMMSRPVFDTWSSTRTHPYVLFPRWFHQ